MQASTDYPFHFDPESPIEVYSPTRVKIYGNLYNIYEDTSLGLGKTTFLQGISQYPNRGIYTFPASYFGDLGTHMGYDLKYFHQREIQPYLALTTPLRIAQLWHTGRITSTMLQQVAPLTVLDTQAVKLQNPVHLDSGSILFAVIPRERYFELRPQEEGSNHEITFFDNNLQSLGRYWLDRSRNVHYMP